MVRRFIRLIRWSLMAGGLLLLGAVAAAFTPLPWMLYRAMATPGVSAPPPPVLIVMMGGGGIPSESGLMRTWKTAEAAGLFPEANVLVAMPLKDESSAVESELILRGVRPDRLLRETRGRNTREQAREVFRMLQGEATGSASVLGLVTSPEHMRRTWQSFQAAGMTNLIAMPAWPEALLADLRYDEGDLGTTSLGGAVGENTMIRYRCWDNLVILVKCAREAAALAYYRVMGWI